MEIRESGDRKKEGREGGKEGGKDGREGERKGKQFDRQFVKLVTTEGYQVWGDEGKGELVSELVNQVVRQSSGEVDHDTFSPEHDQSFSRYS